MESHSLPVFESLGPHVKIQPSSSSELDAVTESLEHDFDRAARKPEAHECPRTTALGWDGGQANALMEARVFV